MAKVVPLRRPSRRRPLTALDDLAEALAIVEETVPDLEVSSSLELRSAMGGRRHRAVLSEEG